MLNPIFQNHLELKQAFERDHYFISDINCRKLLHCLALKKPIGLRGEPGVGKSELPERFAGLIGAMLIDIECHSQLEASDIGVSWNAFKQMVDSQTGKLFGEPFSLPYLNQTPLVSALFSDDPVVLRIDEVDKLNDTTSNFFLRFLDKQELVVHDLADTNQVLRPKSPIYVFLTSNDYRELDPAIMRRISWINLAFPEEKIMTDIITAKTPVSTQTARRIAHVVSRVRGLPLKKSPCIGEVLEWTKALHAESEGRLTLDAIQVTLGLLVKYEEDEQKVWQEVQTWADSLRA